jgi:hypothetical protein
MCHNTRDYKGKGGRLLVKRIPFPLPDTKTDRTRLAAYIALRRTGFTVAEAAVQFGVSSRQAERYEAEARTVEAYARKRDRLSHGD